MGQVVELVFEAIDIESVRSLLGLVLDRSEGQVDVVIDDAPAVWAAGRPPAIPELFASLSVRLGTLRLDDNVAAPNAAVRSFRYDSRFDVEISFDLDDVRDAVRFVDVLFLFANQAATASGAETYFAGLEPASDEETRLFTKLSRGPLHLGSKTS